jgi:hypothetical protein
MADKIRLYGRWMQVGVALLGALAAVVTVYVVWLAAFDRPRLDDVLSGYLMNRTLHLTFSPAALAALFLIGLANLAITCAGLNAVWRIGEAFARGEVFVPATAHALRRLGGVLLVGAASTMISRTASIALATTVPEGNSLLSIGLGSSEGFLLLAGLMMLVLGHVMVLAIAIDAENRAFV